MVVTNKHKPRPGRGSGKGSLVSVPVDADGRVARVREVVLTAACQLLTESEIGEQVTIDAVADRAGVSEAAIYRHWRTVSALLLDACARLGAHSAVPDTGSIRVDLLVLATDLAEKLQTARWATVLPSIIDAAERDPGLVGAQTQLLADLIGPFRTVIERGRKEAKLSGDDSTSDLIAAIVGPLFYRRWFSREHLDERFVRNVIDNVLASNRRR
jgi:AcrR family transcriptional regulator